MQNEHKNISISVIIPAFNSQDFIEKSIISVLKQEILPNEIIIIDDGSTDKTKTIVESIINTHKESKPKFKYLQQKNQGPAAARNLGIKIASGNYIAFLDSDDRWLPSRLRKQIEILYAKKDIRLVCSGRIRTDEATGVQTINCIGGKLSKDGYYDLWTKGNYITTSSVLVCKDCFKTVGLFDEDPRVFGAEDAEMWMRIAQEFSIFYIDEPLVEYLVRPAGVNRSNIKRSYESVVFIIKKHEQVFRRKYPNAEFQMRQKWGRVFLSWGSALFYNEQFAEAKEKFHRSLIFRKFSFSTMLFYFLTLLGPSTLKTLKHIKKQMDLSWNY